MELPRRQTGALETLRQARSPRIPRRVLASRYAAQPRTEWRRQGVSVMNRFLQAVGLFAALAIFAIHGHAAQMIGAASGSCINLPEHQGSAPDGTRVRLFHCHDTPNQVWTVSNGQIMS